MKNKSYKIKRINYNKKNKIKEFNLKKKMFKMMINKWFNLNLNQFNLKRMMKYFQIINKIKILFNLKQKLNQFNLKKMINKMIIKNKLFNLN